MATKYFLYARKSSESEERQVMSIESQLLELKEIAQREGIDIVDSFVESKSAKTPGRIEFGKMIERIKASPEPIGIIAWHPDRLARNSIDGGQVVYLIDTKQICALRFPTFWFEPTPQGLFMLQVAFGQSKYYSDNLGQNVARGIRQKIRRGEWMAKAPVGYLNNARTRNIESDPVNSKIIQQFFKDYAEGKCNINGAKELLSSYGILSRTGKLLGSFRIQTILSNPIYYGAIKFKGEYFEGKFEPIISKELFDAVQARLHDRSKPRFSKKELDFGFKGLLKCGECGCSITAQIAKWNGGTYRYYRCGKSRGRCSQSYLREDLMHHQFVEELGRIGLPEGWATEMRLQIDVWEKNEQQAIIQFVQSFDGKLKVVDAKLDNLLNVFIAGAIDKDVFLKKKQELINEKQSLKEKKEGFGKEGSLLFFEPLRNWVNISDSAGKLNVSSKMSEINDLAKNVSSNRAMAGKKIGFDFVAPYSDLTEYKGLGQAKKKNGSKKEKGKPVINTGLPVWWAIQDSNQ
jgi:site-specific DNA recombinase